MQEITGSIGLSLGAPDVGGTSVANIGTGSKPAPELGFFNLFTTQVTSGATDLDAKVDPASLLEGALNNQDLSGKLLPQNLPQRPIISEQLSKTALTDNAEQLSALPAEELSLRSLIAERLNLSESSDEIVDQDLSLQSIISEHLDEAVTEGGLADLDLSLRAFISKYLNNAEMNGDIPDLESSVRSLLPDTIGKVTELPELDMSLRSVISEYINDAAMEGDIPDLDLSLRSMLSDQMDVDKDAHVEELPDLQLSLSSIISDYLDKTGLVKDLSSADLAPQSVKPRGDMPSPLSLHSILSDQLSKLERGMEMPAPSLSTAQLSKLGVESSADNKLAPSLLTQLDSMTNLSLDSVVDKKPFANLKPEVLTTQGTLEALQNNFDGELLTQPLANERGTGAQQVKGAPAASTVGYAAITEQLSSQGWGDDLVSRVKWQLGQEIQEAKISLNPRELGPLSVKIHIVDDQAQVQFVSQHGSVRDAIEDAMPRLREMLGQSGLMLADADVSQHSPDQQRSFFGTAENRTGQSDSDVNVTDLEQTTKVVRQGAGLVDAFI